jgi:hypothetical protein
MLDAEGWRAAAGAFGDLIVAVPASDSLVVARRANLDDIADLRAAVRQHYETAERGVSPTLCRGPAAGFVPVE